MNDLFHSPPIAYKANGDDWKLYTSTALPLKSYQAFSAGAFCFKNTDKLDKAMKQAKLDIAMSFEFKDENEASILHLKTSKEGRFFADFLAKIVKQFSGGIEIQVY